MSGSTLRSFRHTATVVTLKIMSGLSEVLGEVDKEEAVVVKQRDTEKKKARSDKARLKALEAKIDEVNGRKEALEGFLQETFDS